MSRWIPFLSPEFPPIEDVMADYKAILGSRIYSNGGPFEQDFAEAVCAWVGNGAAASLVASATAGLQLAVSATFLRGRSEALVASFTFASPPLVLRWCGYNPVFLDIEEHSWQPSLSDAEGYLAEHGEDSAGILLTNTFGTANAAVEKWEQLASDHDLPLVIDSAAGFGSEYLTGERVGNRGSCEVFSFHATKTLAVGEGGAVVSKDHELISRIDRLKNFGFDERRNAIDVGTNAKLGELSCAIGLRQMAALPDRLRIRRAILERYRRGLAGAVFQPLAEVSALAFVPILLPSSRARATALGSLAQDHIDVRTYYNPPVHLQAAFAGGRLASVGVPATVEMAARVVSLPLHDSLGASDIDRVVEAVVPALRGL